VWALLLSGLLLMQAIDGSENAALITALPAD
jgi:hypothetical protein